MLSVLKEWLAVNHMGLSFQIAELSKDNNLDYLIIDETTEKTVTFALKSRTGPTALGHYLDGKTFILPEWELKEKEKKHESHRPTAEPAREPSKSAPVSG